MSVLILRRPNALLSTKTYWSTRLLLPSILTRGFGSLPSGSPHRQVRGNQRLGTPYRVTDDYRFVHARDKQRGYHSTMMASALSFPWTKQPLVMNAPMGGGIAGSRLAIAVSSTGGLGFIGVPRDLSAVFGELQAVHDYFTSNNIPDISYDSLQTLPVGIGFLLFINKLDAVLDILRKAAKPPAIVWLFAAPEPDSTALYAEWVKALKREFQHTQVWIQVGGGVTETLKLVKTAKPDVVVVQGSDAGGHGLEVGASLLSVLPETIDALEAEGINIPVVAAGGIAEARAAAAAFSLGANGVVLGTRYLASKEITLPHPAYQQRIVATKDGAANTVRAKVFDELTGPNMWPVTYDGRALVSNSYRDWKGGATSDEIIARMKAETDRGKDGDMGFGADSNRAAIWAGTGVGLVKSVMSAADITVEIREGVAKVLERAKSRL